MRLTLVLTLVALAAGLAIGFVHNRTAEKIEQQEQQAQQQALNRVFPDGVTIEEQQGDSALPRQYWVARKDGALVGYAFPGMSRGYSSDIKFIVGVTPGGEIIGLTVLSQAETPGLGTRVQEVPSTKYIWNGLFVKTEEVLPWFTQQFVGIDATSEIEIRKGDEWHKLDEQRQDELERQNAITAITGATISTRAVIRGVESIVPEYLRALNQHSGENL